MHRFASILVVASACGTTPSAEIGPDAPPDAPATTSPDPIDRIDWRTTRGAPFATTVADLPATELFALGGERFATRSACDPSTGCSYAWHDDAGAVVRTRDRMIATTQTSTSPDGSHAVLVALDELEHCPVGTDTYPVARGTLGLLALATGDAAVELPIRTDLWSADGFTADGAWFFAAPLDVTACATDRTGVRSIDAPFAAPPGLDPTMFLIESIDAHRWLVGQGFEAGVIDPDVPGSFVSLGDDASGLDVSGGWVHVYQGFGNEIRSLTSLPPTGPIRQTQLSDTDWFAFGTWGRWVRACGLQRDGYRDCRVVDALGEIAPVDFRATIAPDHRDDAVLLGRDGAIVFVGPTDDGDRAVQRIDLATGAREVLHRGDGRLRPLGDGAAALLVQDGVASLVEAHREEPLADGVRRVVIAPRRSPASLLLPRGPSRQEELALLIGGADATLTIVDLRTRRSATVADHAFVTAPPPNADFAFDDGCGQPWTTRHAGGVFEGLLQDPESILFFVEQGALWLVPIDLSSPPRRLAELGGDPSACHAPLSTGGRAGFAEDAADGITRVTRTR